MKRTILTLTALVLLATSAWAGQSFPDLALKGKLTAPERTYLGVSSDSFKLSDIKAEYLFIEGYSMYCPVCQRDAERVNEVLDELEARGLGDRIKFIGLALGNTAFEVAFYKKKYGVKFPLFEDEDYAIHKALGEVPTPTFYVVKMGKPSPEILFIKEGEAEDKAALLKAILDATGLK